MAQASTRIKNLCFRFAAKSGLTISIDDVKTPAEKAGSSTTTRSEAEKVEDQFRRGIITDGERRQKEVEIWTDGHRPRSREAMETDLKAEQFNPIEMMVGSGARGNMMQVRQIAGMRGLVANPRGDMIPRPIKSNFREGLAMLEYFIATPGARKGLVDTALRTADSGYLTRRLVDVAQELIIREDDCAREGDPVRGIWIEDIAPDTAGKRTYLETRLFGRVAGRRRHAGRRHGHRGRHRWSTTTSSAPLRDDTDGHPGPGALAAHLRRRARRLRHVLRPLAGHRQDDRARRGRRRHRRPVDRRARHPADHADLPHRRHRRCGDIAGGLPRVVELFEARSPKGKATLARTSGVVRIARTRARAASITVVGDDGDRGRLHGARASPASR